MKHRAGMLSPTFPSKKCALNLRTWLHKGLKNIKFSASGLIFALPQLTI